MNASFSHWSVFVFFLKKINFNPSFQFKMFKWLNVWLKCIFLLDLIVFASLLWMLLWNRNLVWCLKMKWPTVSGSWRLCGLGCAQRWLDATKNFRSCPNPKNTATAVVLCFAASVWQTKPNPYQVLRRKNVVKKISFNRFVSKGKKKEKRVCLECSPQAVTPLTTCWVPDETGLFKFSFHFFFFKKKQQLCARFPLQALLAVCVWNRFHWNSEDIVNNFGSVEESWFFFWKFACRL